MVVFAGIRRSLDHGIGPSRDVASGVVSPSYSLPFAAASSGMWGARQQRGRFVVKLEVMMFCDLLSVLKV